MKEDRIIAFTSIYPCLIMAKLMTETIHILIWLGLAIYWILRYSYLKFWK